MLTGRYPGNMPVNVPLFPTTISFARWASVRVGDGSDDLLSLGVLVDQGFGGRYEVLS